MKTILAPAVLVTALAMQKVRAWTKMAAGEFSALGNVAVHQGDMLITDVHLVEQVSSAGSTEMDDEGVARLLIELEEAGEDSSSLRLWVHSHGHSDVFWSSTDERCIRGLDGGEWVLSWVCNKANEDRLRLDLFQPLRLTIDHIGLQLHSADLGLADWCEQEFKDKVDERPLVVRSGVRSCFQTRIPASPRLLDPPWPTGEFADPDEESLNPDADWWDRDWTVPDDDNQLALQIDDPWGQVMKLGDRR